MLIEISSGLVVLLFNTLILKITGNIGVAAYGVVCNIWLVCIAIFNGLAHGMQPLLVNPMVLMIQRILLC